MTPCSLLGTIVSEQPSLSVITVEMQATDFYALVPVYQIDGITYQMFSILFAF
jgi:hypothetical protein